MITPGDKQTNNNKNLLLSVSCILFLISSTLPAIFPFKGYKVFSIGATFLFSFSKIEQFITGLFWGSNLIYFIGLLSYYRNKRWSIPLLIIAFLVGVGFKIHMSIDPGEDIGVGAFQIGYYCWLLSFISIPLLQYYFHNKKSKNEIENEMPNKS